MNYQIQGLSIHAEVHGTAEPALVFLHYWGGTSPTWHKVIKIHVPHDPLPAWLFQPFVLRDFGQPSKRREQLA
jgi:hypothetical protein